MPYKKDIKEFNQLVRSGDHYLDLLVRTVGVYFVILGALLKLFFDGSFGTERLAFFFFGMALNLSGIFLCSIALYSYKKLAQRCDLIARKIDQPNFYFPLGIVSAKGFRIVIVVFTVLWIGLFSLTKSGLDYFEFGSLF